MNNNARVVGYLEAWGLKHLIEKFEEESVDDTAFDALDVDSPDLKELVPKFGDRAKFIKFYKNLSNPSLIIISSPPERQPSAVHQYDGFQEDPSFTITQGHLRGVEGDIPEEGIVREVIPEEVIPEEVIPEEVIPEEDIPTPLKRQDSFVGTPADIEYTYNLNLKAFLRKTVTGQRILANKDKLTPQLRNELASLLIDHDLQNDVNSYIPTARLLQLARCIKKEFPKEQIETYYVPYVRRGKKVVQCMKGKLVDRYHNQRKKLRKDGIIKTSIEEKSPEDAIAWSQETVQDVDDLCIWLKYNDHPWPDVLTNWKSTCKIRIEKYKYDVDLTIDGYFEEYKVLKKPIGYQLLEIDFDFLHPNIGQTFFVEIHKKKAAILQLLEERGVIKQLYPEIEQNSLSQDGLAILTLIGLPYLLPPIIVSSNKKWKPSKLEVAESFILHLKNGNELNAARLRKKEKCLRQGVTCQPSVYFVGADLDNTLQGYVEVNEVLYKIDPALRAIDVCFKCCHSLFASYSVECCHVWQFVQLYLYNMKTKWDKNFTGVNSLLSDLQV